MRNDTWDEDEVARLLRELAAELLAAEGPARNGLFLELHRLHDTIFRTALQTHPDAAPALAAQAFAVSDALPAPQVVRELHTLRSDLVTPEIRALYKHMNAARNNLVHQSTLERVIVSRRNSKRMAQLARLIAAQLDPERESHAGLQQEDDAGGAEHAWLWAILALGVALVLITLFIWGWATIGPGFVFGALGAALLLSLESFLLRGWLRRRGVT